jgi:methylated-DNA-protein-cysteine methyltransferase-like protein
MPRQPGRRRRPTRPVGRAATGTADQRVPKFARAVYAVVRGIPRPIATYGQIAAISAIRARRVGTALSHLPKPFARLVPWQRVINAAGRISHRGDVLRPDLQRQLLELEGIEFRGDHVDLRRFRWAGPKRERRVRTRVEL